MANLLLVGSIPPTLRLPNEAEIGVIEEFASSEQQLDVLRRRVAEGMAKAVNDPQTVTARANTIFTATNSALEKVLAKGSEDFEPWSYGSPQPRILSRAVELPPLIRFLKAGFGLANAQFGDVAPTGITGGERSFAEFFFAAFLEEAALARKVGLPPSIDEVIEVIWKGKKQEAGSERTREEWIDKKLGGMPTHTFRWFEENFIGYDEWFQYLAHIDQKRVRKFQKKVEDWYFKSKKRDEICFRYDIDEFDKLRREYHSGIYHRSIDDFISRWSRERFFNGIKADAAYFSYSKELVNILLDAIVNGRLPTDDAAEEGLAAPETSPEQGEPLPRSLQDRLRELDTFASKNPGDAVSSKVLELFPEIGQLEERGPDLPAEAPVKWPEGRIAVKGVLETPPQFIERVYAPWLGMGLTRADVRRLNPELVQSLYYHIRKHGEPEGFDLPSKPQQTTRWVEAVERGEEQVGRGRVGMDAIRDARRFESARQRRRSKPVAEE